MCTPVFFGGIETQKKPLFDYKTDRFTQPGELKERYKGQMSLYAKALSQAYQIDKIDKYLILLGGQDLEVVEV